MLFPFDTAWLILSVGAKNVSICLSRLLTWSVRECHRTWVLGTWYLSLTFWFVIHLVISINRYFIKLSIFVLIYMLPSHTAVQWERIMGFIVFQYGTGNLSLVLIKEKINKWPNYRTRTNQKKRIGFISFWQVFISIIVYSRVNNKQKRKKNYKVKNYVFHVW